LRSVRTAQFLSNAKTWQWHARFAQPTTPLVHTDAYLAFAFSLRAASRMTLHDDHFGVGAAVVP
jgi:hypothetical protein